MKCEDDTWDRVKLVLLSVLDEVAFDALNDSNAGNFEAAVEVLTKRFGKPPHICLSQLMAMK